MSRTGLWCANNELVTGANLYNQRSHHVWGPHIVQSEAFQLCLLVWKPHEYDFLIFPQTAIVNSPSGFCASTL